MRTDGLTPGALITNQAVRSGDLAKVRELLAAGVDVSTAAGEILFSVQTSLCVMQWVTFRCSSLFCLNGGQTRLPRDSQSGSALKLCCCNIRERRPDKTCFSSTAQDINGRDADGFTPLMVANSNLRVAEFLVLNGADVNAQTKTGLSVLMNACIHADQALIEYLIRAGAAPEVPDNDGIGRGFRSRC